MDEIDLAQERETEIRNRAIAAAAQELKPGTQGDCEICGEWSGRLINAACAHCRDKFRLG